MNLEMGPRVIFSLFHGHLLITETVCFSVLVSICLIVFAVLSTRNMKQVPTGLQAVAELIVEKIYGMVEGTMGKQNIKFAPYMGTLFMFLLPANSLGLIGMRPVTADMNTAFALGAITFILIQYNSMRSKGFLGFFKHMAQPYAFMAPINVVEELAFPISLSFRLFGNITGGVIIMDLIYMGLGHLSSALPIPILNAIIPLPGNIFFDVFEPVLQAFIFTMLTMVFISKAITLHEVRSEGLVKA